MKQNPKDSKFSPKGDKISKGGKKYGRHRNSKPKDKKECDETKVSGDINDASYYYDNPDLLNQITNYSFEQFMGMPIEVGDSFFRLRYWAGNIMHVWLNPAVQPTTDDVYSSLYGINMAATKNYLMLSANNAKTTNYGPQDPMALTLAMTSVVQMYSFIKRAFGIAYLYNTRNREYPTRLLEGMCIDADDFRKNLAAYRVRFNTDIALLDRIPFPKDIPAVKKAEEMFANIYLDEASPMAQTYLFNLYSVWVINEAYNPQGIGLDTVQVYSSNLEQFDYFLSIFETQIAALANSSLLNYVYSDILRVCGDNLFVLPTISEVYNVMPGVNPETRIWLHNMIKLAPPLDLDQMPSGLTSGATGSNDVETNSNGDGLNYHPVFKISASVDQPQFRFLQNAVVDFETLNPTVEERVAATRLAVRTTTVVSNETGLEGTYTNNLPVLGDYYCVKLVVDDGNAYTELGSWFDQFNIRDANTLRVMINMLCKLDQFNFAPLVYCVRTSPNGDGGYLDDIHGDLNYFTTLDYEYMKSMRDAEMMAEFSFSRSLIGK